MAKRPRKRYFTLEEATATLPLLRSILRDVTELAQELGPRQQRLLKLQASGASGRAHEEELQALLADLERGQDRMREYEDELRKLGVELKDYMTGLVDFPCWMDGREVYLCWRLGEDEIGHWHELDAGFAGRQKLPQQVLS
jgi:hypothetical protein